MRVVHCAWAVLLFGVPLAACTAFGERADCEWNPYLCEGGAGGGSGTSVVVGVPRCDDGVMNGAETGVDCGAAAGCSKCNGDVCGAPGECESGFCVDGVCCDSGCDAPCLACHLAGVAGTCSSLPAGEDDPACDSRGGCGALPGSCRCEDQVQNGDETDVDCGGASCGHCIGAPCSAPDGSECASGHCVDLRCCNSKCNGDCRACDVPDHPGVCSFLAPGVTDDPCGDGQLCNGAGECKLAAGEECAGDTDCLSRTCVSDECKACSGHDECVGAGAHLCVGGICIAMIATGELCATDAQCASENCLHGLCCPSDCTGLCTSCRSEYTGQPDGTCAPIKAGYDPGDACIGSGAADGCSGEAAGANGDSSCGTAP